MITVVDVTNFNQASPRNYKQIPLADAIPAIPCTEYSRYEVLQQKIRKLYFDLDGIPNDDAKLLRDFIEDYNRYLINKEIITDPIEFVATINTNSSNHPGIGSHIIAKSITMDAAKQHTLLLAFLSEFEGAEKYKKYVDTSVYSGRQLFKLPHFIGLPMINLENYHCMTDTENRTDYIIQKITDCKYLNPNIHPNKEWKKAEKHLSYTPNRGTYMVKELYDAILGRRSTNHLNIHKHIDRAQSLLLNDHITDSLTKRLNDIIEDLHEKRNIEISIGLLDHIERKLANDRRSES